MHVAEKILVERMIATKKGTREQIVVHRQDVMKNTADYYVCTASVIVLPWVYRYGSLQKTGGTSQRKELNPGITVFVPERSKLSTIMLRFLVEANEADYIQPGIPDMNRTTRKYIMRFIETMREEHAILHAAQPLLLMTARSRIQRTQFARALYLHEYIYLFTYDGMLTYPFKVRDSFGTYEARLPQNIRSVFEGMRRNKRMFPESDTKFLTHFVTSRNFANMVIRYLAHPAWIF